MDAENQFSDVEWFIDRIGNPENIHADSSTDFYLYMTDNNTSIINDIQPTISFTKNYVVICKEFEVTDLLCAVCMEDQLVSNMCRLSCCHTFCSTCIQKYIDADKRQCKNETECPLCRHAVSCVYVQNSENRLKFICGI
jgi:hypothetical protein